MILKKLLLNVSVLNFIGDYNINVLDVQFDSRKIHKGSLFIAVRGELSDGHSYIEEAILSGAKVIVVEQIPSSLESSVTYVMVANSADALALISSNFYSNPSRDIKLIGVTGTNGKTTIVNLLYDLFILFGIRVGMLSTINNKINQNVISSTHTTPDALQINFLLRRMVEEGCEYCFMEVSSHAVSQSRIKGLFFDAGVFTNISRDHLDYHKNFENYIEAKKLFFDLLPKSSFALINTDDSNSIKMIESTKAEKVTYSLNADADYKCKIMEHDFEGMLLNLDKSDVWIRLVGRFNAYNILCVYAIAHKFGFEKKKILTEISMLNSPEGRFQCVKNKEMIAIVDYAHTPNALENILFTINDIRTRKEKLITVVGCGGDRDKTKRSYMASIACSNSNQVIFTSDNPRSEDPNLIIDDMIRELDLDNKNKILVIVDRRQAIRTACKLAQSKDIILIAGKGHEKYQEVDGKRLPFDDLYELKKSLNLTIK